MSSCSPVRQQSGKVDFSPLLGGCLCGTSRYEIVAAPLTLYACHCTDCQTVSGASFTLILVVTRDAIAVREGSPEPYERARADGRKKTIFRCPLCLTALWGARIEASNLATVYAGTLDGSAALDSTALCSMAPGTDSAVEHRRGAGFLDRCAGRFHAAALAAHRAVARASTLGLGGALAKGRHDFLRAASARGLRKLAGLAGVARRAEVE